jgi:cytochrome c peroxidase
MSVLGNEKLALGERGAMSHNWVLGGIMALGLGSMVPAAAGAGDAGWRNERPAVARHYFPEPSTGSSAASLGEKLFFDTRLSRTGATACASCHRPEYAFAEPRRVSVSDSGRRGERNAPSLVNVGYVPALMWDGRFRTLEQQALSPFLRGEMGITVEEAEYRLRRDPEYVYLFDLAFGRPPSADGLAAALAAYQRTLVSGESRFERFLRTSDPRILTALEREGYGIFDGRARCSTCHHFSRPRADPWREIPLLLTDSQFHNLGIGYRSGRFADPGRFSVTGRERDVGAFRTPSLRNLDPTGPYMHDGSLATLEEVVEFYARGGRPNPYLSPLLRPLFLTSYEKAALIAFLRSLNEPEYAPVGAAQQW